VSTGASRSRPVTLGFLGIHSAGRVGQPPGQDELLSELLAAEGVRVRLSSSVRRPALRTLDQAIALLRWRDLDALVVATYSGPSFFVAELGTHLARWRRRPVLLFLHGGNLPEWAERHPKRIARTFGRADRLLAPSDYLADAFRALGHEVATVPNVVRLERYEHRRRTPARPAVLWMRTLQELYDPLLAIAAFARVHADHPGATLTMAGADRGMLEPARALAEELGVGDAVTFPGYLDAAGKARAFADHDVFLNTNKIDNMPVSVIEAGACGLIPIATAVGGIPALLRDGEDSLLVPSGDIDAMATALARVLDDADLAARLSDGARRTAERSGWPSVRARWAAELRGLGVALGPA
jgi:glycosyltransferase involved in cell wall biosynthesis